LAATLAIATALGQSLGPRTTRDGVFSSAQVERGRESFDGNCADCHEIEEFTGAGAYFEEMDGEPLWRVFDFIWSEMPEDRPAWLEPQEYADILAYILSVYGMPTGEADMPIEQTALDGIHLARPERPGS
jgi:S-disulfanyl-L-cysteine oxidoreductase SoxD